MKRKIALIIAVVMVLAVAAATARHSPDMRAVVEDMGELWGSDLYKITYLNNGTPMPDVTIIDMLDWVVAVRREGDKPRVSVGFDFTKENADEILVKINEHLAMTVFPDNGRPIYVSVIFSNPVPFEEFSRLVEESGMKVVRYEIRGFEQDGRPVTIGGAPDGNTLIPQNKIERFQSQAAAQGRPFVIAGIINADGYLTQEGYEVLMNSGRVHFVNVMRFHAKQIVKDRLGIDVAAEDIIGPMPFVKPRR